MLRAYIRAIPGLSEARQIDMAKEANGGAEPVMYVEAKGTFPTERDNAIRSLRASKRPDELGVARLAILANDRPGLRAILATIKDKGFVIRETSTGRVLAPADWPDAILDAVNYWTSRMRRFGDMTYSEAGAEGGKALAKKRRKQRMSKIEAAKIWLDPTLTGDEAIAKINADDTYEWKWSVTTAHRILGPRWKRRR